MGSYKPVLKPFGHRLFELSQSLSVIQDSIEAIKVGKLHQLIPLSGQLRSLLAEKSRRNRPLLLSLAKELKEEINVYAMPDIDYEDEVILFMTELQVSLEQKLPGQELVSVQEFLDRKILIYMSEKYSIKDIIEFYANKAGGSHYALDIPKDFADLLTIHVLGQPPIAHALLQFGEVTYALGHRLLKRMIDSEIQLLLFVPEEAMEKESYVFDFKHSNSPMRLYFSITPRIRPQFGIVSLNEHSVIVPIERVIDWGKPHHWLFSIELEENLSTSLSVYVDGERLAKQYTREFLLIWNDFTHYECYINRSFEKPDSGLTMACTFVMGHKVNHSVVERARVTADCYDMLSNDEIPCTYFPKGSYCHLPINQGDPIFSGDCVQWDMKKLANGELPTTD